MGLFERIYDPVMVPADALGLARWRDWATAIRGQRVLEVGVGTGLNLPHYSAGRMICGFDPSGAMLRHAVRRSRHDGTRRPCFCQAFAEEMPFADHVFDAAVGTLVFCTIADPVKALAELRRVLLPSSPLRLIEHVRLKGRGASRVQDLLTPFWRRVAGGCTLNRDTVRIVEGSGFKVLMVEEHLGGLFIGIDARAPAGAAFYRELS
jgi:ubiquinone/menaquinone biosynthesis C-methylase UbiE